MPSANTNEIYDLDEGKDSLDVRLAFLEHPATKTVDFSTYEIIFDQAGKTFLAALIRAAERGVKVRGIVDRRIAQAHPMLIPYLQEKGIEIKFYSPIILRTWELLLSPIRLFRRFNSRLHDKMFIINSSVMVIGDKNYGNKYFNKLSILPKKNFYMSGKEVLLKGEGVSEFLNYFNTLWNHRDEVTPIEEIPKYANLELTDKWRKKLDQSFARFKRWIEKRVRFISDDLEMHSYDNAEFIHSSNGETTLAKIFKKIKNAKKGTKIVIENSYFVMFPELREILKTAIANGVEITLHLNYTPEKWVLAQSLAIDLNEIIDMGIKIFLNRDVPTHAKMVLIETPDGNKEVIITSANFDPRSFRLNSESGLSVRSATLHDYYLAEFQREKKGMVDVSITNQCIRFYAGKNLLPKSNFWGRSAVKFLRPQL